MLVVSLLIFFSYIVLRNELDMRDWNKMLVNQSTFIKDIFH